jgi:hypothetical protein
LKAITVKIDLYQQMARAAAAMSNIEASQPSNSSQGVDVSAALACNFL